MVERKPPPAAVIAVTNPMVHALAGSPLGRLLPSSVTSLRFTGRKSGRPLRVAVLLHDIDGVPTVFTERPWRLNFAGGAAVTVARKGRKTETRGELIEDQSLVAPAWREAIRAKGYPKLGLSGPKGEDPSVEELAALGESMIRLEL